MRNALSTSLQEDIEGVVISGHRIQNFRASLAHGTGKTTFLSRQVEKEAGEYGGRSLMIASFTRAAAAELAGRDLPVDRQQIGTLHAHCYRALGRPDIAETKVEQFNSENPAYQLSAGNAVKLDESAADQVFNTDADRIFAQYQMLRAKMVRREMWPLSVAGFARRWEEWKRQNRLTDFTDMIEVCLNEMSAVPGSPSVGFFDEVQDFTPLELALVRKWGSSMDKVFLAGDDDQCQAGDEPIYTANRGRVEMQALEPDTDRLVAWDKVGGGIRYKKGYSFRQASRSYDGDMITISAGACSTRVTPNHRVYARWNEQGRAAHAVYLMKKGNWWRIGTTRIILGWQGFGPAMRARQEKADAFWVVGVTDSDSEARLLEEVYSVQHGIPKMVFHADGSRFRDFSCSSERLTEHHEQLSIVSTIGAERLLRACGLLIQHPFRMLDGSSYKQKGAKAIWLTQAANLIPPVWIH